MCILLTMQHALLRRSAQRNKFQVVYGMKISVTGTAHFVTLRDVDAREELTVTYLDTEMNVNARQSHLQFAYGFTCKCSACVEDVNDGCRSQCNSK